MPFSHALDGMPWEDLPQGVQQKKVREGHMTVRLVRFPAGFAGEAACTKGHSGYVLDGACSWDIGGKTVKVARGDAITIPDGPPHRVFAGAEAVTMLLMEFHK